MNNRHSAYLREHSCPVCKKNFIPAPLHRYKISSDEPVCSWTCLCKWRRDKEEEKQKKREEKEQRKKKGDAYECR